MAQEKKNREAALDLEMDQAKKRRLAVMELEMTQARATTLLTLPSLTFMKLGYQYLRTHKFVRWRSLDFQKRTFSFMSCL